MKNNIFEFATSELSQDAFICWCVNWFNDKSNVRLNEMAKRLIKEFLGEKETFEISSLEILRQFSEDVIVDDKKLALKIDVLLMVNKEIAIIIEDKTNTGEHDDQINRYKRGLVELSNKSDSFNIKDVKTVYYKTGYMFDSDKLVKADIVFDSNRILEFFKAYKGESEILDSYIDNLENQINDYKKFGDFEAVSEDDFWNWNISKHHIAQLNFMRSLFPEKLWEDKSSWDYRVYHGTSYGRPWTQMCICNRNYYGTNNNFSVFWRIDTDSDGPYLSLRLYEGYDKNDMAQKNWHRKTYDVMSNVVKNIIESNEIFAWKDVYPGYRGNYKESALLHINLKNVIQHWKTEENSFVEKIKVITEEFSKEIQTL